ncbi:hypothetical protein BAZO_12599, partial [Schinkia azotoformans LMG 9581]
FFFFQAEDGIRDIGVTGVQTCALPISLPSIETGPDNVLNSIKGAFLEVRHRQIADDRSSQKVN